MQISVFFKKTKFTSLKSINFHFKMPAKQILVIFQTKQGKILTWPKSSALNLPNQGQFIFRKYKLKKKNVMML